MFSRIKNYLTIFFVSFIFCCNFTSNDGEGEVELLHSQTKVGDTRWYPQFIYKIGEEGIEVGGGIKIFIPTNCIELPKFYDNIEKLIQDQFLTITTSKGGKLDYKGELLQEEGWLIQVTVKAPALKKNENIIVNFNNNLVPKISGRYKVKIQSDVNGDGVYKDISIFPEFVIYPTLLIKTLNVVKKGEYFDLTLVSITGDDNLFYEGEVTFSVSDKKAIFPKSYKFKRGEKRHTFTKQFALFTEGIVEIKVKDEKLGFEVSKEIICRDKDLSYNLYFGDTHGHTSASDGTGTPERYYEIGRDVENLDFTILTDHDYHIDENKWNYLKNLANYYNKEGEFVTLNAFEWSHKLGDKNCYFLDDDPEIHRRFDEISDHPLKLFDSYREKKVLIIPHHPLSAFRPTDWSFHDPSIQRLVEIYSLHGRAEYYLNPNPITPHTPLNQKYTTPVSVLNVRGRAVQDALAKGYRLGIIASGDNHAGYPGDIGIAALYAKDLTRESIFEALYERRAYGTTHARIVLEFKLDDHFMGEEYISDKSPLISAYVVGTAPIKLIEIIKNNEVIYSYQGKDRIEEITYKDEGEKKTSNYYYLRVTQIDGEMAWSSPIWLDLPFPEVKVSEIDFERLNGEELIKIKGIIENIGKYEAKDVTISFYDNNLLIGEKKIDLIEPSSKKEIEILWEGYKLPGRHQIYGFVNQEKKNFFQKEYLVAPKLYFSKVLNEKAKGGVRYPFKSFKFETEDEDIRIEIEGEVEFHGVKGKSIYGQGNSNPKVIDDDLTFAIDNVNYGLAEPFIFMGKNILNKKKKITVIRSMKKGEHTIQFFADERPTLKSIEIWGSGTLNSDLITEENDDKKYELIESDNDFYWLNFYFEDGVSIWRKRIDSNRLLIYITWSKNYELTSNILEHFRWFRGELRFVNCEYTIFPWRFQEESDYIYDDLKGEISFVSRADKACGLHIIVKPSLKEESKIVFDITNGEERFPEKVWLGSEKPNKLPLYIRLNKPLNFIEEKMDEPFIELKPINSKNMINTISNGDGVILDLDKIYESKKPQYSKIENFEILARQKPESVKLRNKLAYLYIKEENFERALEHLEYSRVRGFANLETFILLSEVFIKKGKLDDAINILNEAINTYPDKIEPKLELSKIYLSKGLFNEGEEILKEVLKKFPENIECYILLGELYRLTKRYNEGIEIYNNVLSIFENEPKVYMGLGAIYTDLQDYEKGLEFYNKALKLDPNSPEKLLKIGDTLKKMGKEEEAEKIYKNILTESPNLANPYIHLATIYEENGNIKEAISYYNEALNKGNNEINILIKLGELYEKVNDLDNASKIYKKATFLYPESAKPHIKLGEIYNLLNLYNDAISEFEKALTIEPQNIQAILLLSETYSLSGQLEKGISLLEKASLENRNEIRFHKKLGNIYFKIGQLDKAIDKFKEVLRIDSDELLAHYKLAKIYKKLGKIEDSIKEWEICYKLAPNSKYGIEAKKNLLKEKLLTKE